MNTNLESQAQKSKAWIKKHPVLFSIVSVLFIWSFVSSFNNSDKNVVVIQPQTLEEKIKTIVEAETTDMSFVGIETEKAVSNKSEGSEMTIVKLNVNSFYKEESLLRDSGEATGKIFQEIFNSNPKAQDVVVWYLGDTVDKYGNTENKVMISHAIDKTTYQKINWANFDSTAMCEFLRSESSLNDGNSICSILVDFK